MILAKLILLGQKIGKTVVRDVSLTDNKGLTFSQQIHDKSYEFPTDFLPETKVKITLENS